MYSSELKSSICCLKVEVITYAGWTWERPCLSGTWVRSFFKSAGSQAKWSLIEDAREFKMRRKWKQNKIYIKSTGPRLHSIESIPCGCKRKKETWPKHICTDFNNAPSQNYWNWRMGLFRNMGLLKSKALLAFKRRFYVVQLWIWVSKLYICISLRTPQSMNK